MVDKECRRCGETRPIEDFIQGKSYADGYQPWCSGCRRFYRLENRDRQRANERAARYGLSFEAQVELYVQQGGCCAACEEPIDFDTAHLDHNHQTGDVRGFLCPSCNRTLGQSRESVDRLIRLAIYLEVTVAIEQDYVAHDPAGPACRNGHEWTDETTYKHPTGTRHCIPCRRESDRKRVKV